MYDTLYTFGPACLSLRCICKQKLGNVHGFMPHVPVSTFKPEANRNSQRFGPTARMDSLS